MHKYKKEGYAFSEEYYCNKCKKAHHFLSEIGKNHIGYARQETQRYGFLKFGVYKK